MQDGQPPPKSQPGLGYPRGHTIPPQPMRYTGCLRHGRSSACEGPSAIGKGVTCGYSLRAQYVSRRVARRHVSAGQGQMVLRPPEP